MPLRPSFTQLRDSGGRFVSNGSGIHWRGLEVLANGINSRGNSLNRTRKLAMERLAREMEEYAKENAPWNDRSGDARNSLHAVAVHDDGADTSTVWLSHGVDYGVWLEIQNAGEFAIVMPTILEFSDKVMATVVELDSVTDILASIYGEG